MPSKTYPRRFTACKPGIGDAVQAIGEPVIKSTSTPAARARTTAEDKLWEALHAHPNSTAAELSVAAGIGKSTAGKILAVWDAEGSVKRTCGIGEGHRRTADRWTIIDTDVDMDSTVDAEFAQAPINTSASTDTANTIEGENHSGIGSDKSEFGADNSAEPVADPVGEGDTVKGTAPRVTRKPARLASGALRGMVEDFLGEHRGQEFGVSMIGKALGRSSGAVNNALETLTKTGYAIKTQEAPKRFTAAPGQEPVTNAVD